MIVKFLHLLGAMLLIGNVITTGLWSHWAMRTHDRAVATFATAAVLKADGWLTLTGGALLTVTGIQMALTAGWTLELGWLRTGVIALGASTAVWLVVLLPLQVRMWRAARAGEVERLQHAYRWWSVVGWADTALLLWGLWAMVAKG